MLRYRQSTLKEKGMKIMMNGLMTRKRGRGSVEVPMMKIEDTETFWKNPSMDPSSSASVVTENYPGEMLQSSMKMFRAKSSFHWRTASLIWMSTPMSLNSGMEKKYLPTIGKF